VFVDRISQPDPARRFADRRWLQLDHAVSRSEPAMDDQYGSAA
jgi:hypothetical protein